NLTSSKNFLHFNIQQDKQKIFRSYRFIRKYNQHIWMPYYIEFSTPTANYTTYINWNNDSNVSFNLLNNNQLNTNGSALDPYCSLNKLSSNVTDI
ncbi:unnamed protein product, partial [Rotaria sp. Silwood1]